MNRPRLQSLLLWLLPLFALRAFIPAGFMLSHSATGLELTFCTGVVAETTSSQSAHAEHEAHFHHVADSSAPSAQGDHSSHEAHERSVCPYSVAGTAPAPTIAYVAAASAVATALVVFSVDPNLSSAPALIDRIRGPPIA